MGSPKVPALTNARHELFAQGIAKGKNQTDAYLAAGYVGDVTAASRLSRDVKVQARVAELKGRAAEKTVTTVETLLAEGWDIITKAKGEADFGAASQTLERVAKIAGLWVDKTKGDLTIRSHEDSLDELDG